MRRPARIFLGVWCLLIGLQFGCFPMAARSGPLGNLPLEANQDAQLRGVQFIDAATGWAVGDRGIIWHTDDGGRTWYRQAAPTTTRLESVCFVDRLNGWAVGGHIAPYLPRTNGVVLRTRDGGKTWSQVPGLTTGWLKTVQFVDAARGWVAGDPSAMYPTGVFRTDDGGRSWTPLPSGISATWLTGTFLDMTRGLVAGNDGVIATIGGAKIIESKTPDLGQRPIHAIRMADEQTGWLVGDSGLILKTGDGGRTWQSATESIPEGVAAQFDFAALAVSGPHVWIAGAPGTVVLASHDGGMSWQQCPTQQSAPIRALSFSDTDHGWAVGDLGTVLATADGGRSWQVQRRGGERLAILAIAGEPRALPLDLFASLSANEGYLGGAEVIGRRIVPSTSKTLVPSADRAAQALSVTGASAIDQSWRFPLRQFGLRLPVRAIVSGWNRCNNGRAVTQMEELVVRRIRQWRPDVVVTEPLLDDGDPALAQIVNQIVLTAVNAAADPTMYPDHMAIARLSPWTVKKVFCRAADARQATVPMITTQLAPRIGTAIVDQVQLGQAALLLEPQRVPLRTGFQLLTSSMGNAGNHKDVFGGIHLEPGGPARRQLGMLPNDLKTMRRITQRQRNLQQILERAEEAPVATAGWLGQISQLTRGMSDSAAAHLLFQLGASYRELGRMELTARSWEQLLDQFPEDALADKVMIELIDYYTSGEASWQLQRRTHFQNGIVRASYEPAVDTTTGDGYAQADDRGVVTATFESRGSHSAAAIGTTTDARAGKALAVGKRLQRAVPQLFAEPSVQFPLSVAYRNKGMPRDAERIYHRLSASRSASRWASCAQAELWLSHHRGASPKPTYTCRHAPSHPYLDGKLDDDAWQVAAAATLRSPYHDDAAWPGSVLLTGDDEFLFVAISCRKAPGGAYPTNHSVRTRDPDLSSADRVDILLDVDRDYRSCYRLTMDYRGWTGETLLDNRHFDPKWYVAAAQTDQDWTVEAAIAWRELVPTAPTQNDVWCIGMRRVVPGVGLQSFGGSETGDSPRPGFGLLMFQQ